MWNKIKQAARNLSKDMQREAPKVGNQANSFAKDAAERLKPYVKEAASTSQSAAERLKPYVKDATTTSQSYATSAAKSAQKYVQSGHAQKEAKKIGKETFVSPAKKIFQSTKKSVRNYTIVLVAVFGFSYGLGQALPKLVETIKGERSEWEMRDAGREEF